MLVHFLTEYAQEDQHKCHISCKKKQKQKNLQYNNITVADHLEDFRCGYG